MLIVDDDADVRLLTRMVIDAANQGLQVAGEAASGDDAISWLDANVPTVVVLDQMMPGTTGLETAQHIRKRHPDLPILLYSAYLTPELELAARGEGINDCLVKTEVSQLPEVLRRLVASA